MKKERIADIVDDERFNNLLALTQKPDEEVILKILKKAAEKKGLDLEDVANLCNCSDPKLVNKIFETAYKIKKDIYGERIVLFAPLYISDFCVNDCEYCNFHCRNKSPRRKLSQKEVASQTKSLIDMGHKRLLLEFGEHPVENPIEYVVETINTIYKIKSANGEIRRVNVNIAATTVENYRKLKEVGIGTYQLFQETYHRPTFEKIHNGPKAEYSRQLFAHNKAFEAGIDDLGIGVLYGLYDWRYEVLALVSHAAYMDKIFGVGPHTISVPRFQETPGVDFKSPCPVSEDELLKIVAILRLAVPYTGMIISTRERPEIREKAFELGISQTSAGSRVEVGGYDEGQKLAAKNPKDEGCGQFTTHDPRTLDQIVVSLCEQGLLQSFCTACYRSLRTGESFMEIAKPGNIHNFCRPNGILTFKEYLLDYATPTTKEKGERLIAEYLGKIPSKKRKQETIDRLNRIEKGERDLYF